MCLGAVFYNAQIMLTRQIHNSVHIRRKTVQMHGQNGFCFFGDFAFNIFRVNIIGARVNIGKNKFCSGQGNRGRRSDKRKRGGNDFVPFADACRAQRNLNGAGAR